MTGGNPVRVARNSLQGAISHSETNKPSRRSSKSPAPRVQCEKVAGACKGRLLYKYDRTGLGQPAHPAAGSVHPGAHGPHSLAVGQAGLVAPGCDPSDAGEPHHLRHYHASCPAGCRICHHLPAPDHPAENLNACLPRSALATMRQRLLSS